MSTTNFSRENSPFLCLTMAFILTMYTVQRQVESHLLIFRGTWVSFTDTKSSSFLVGQGAAWVGVFLYNMLSTDETRVSRVRLGSMFVSLAVVAAFFLVLHKMQVQLADEGAIKRNLTCRPTAGSAVDYDENANVIFPEEISIYSKPIVFVPSKFYSRCSQFIAKECGVNTMVFSSGHDWFEQESAPVGEMCFIWHGFPIYFLEAVSASRYYPNPGTVYLFFLFTGISFTAVLECMRSMLSTAMLVGKDFLRAVVAVMLIIGVNAAVPRCLVFAGRAEILLLPCTVCISFLQCFLVELILRTFIDEERILPWQGGDESVHQLRCAIFSSLRFIAFGVLYLMLGGCTGLVPHVNPFIFILVEIMWDNKGAVIMSTMDNGIQVFMESSMSKEQVQQSDAAAATTPPIPASVAPSSQARFLPSFFPWSPSSLTADGTSTNHLGGNARIPRNTQPNAPCDTKKNPGAKAKKAKVTQDAVPAARTKRKAADSQAEETQAPPPEKRRGRASTRRSQ